MVDNGIDNADGYNPACYMQLMDFSCSCRWIFHRPTRVGFCGFGVGWYINATFMYVFIHQELSHHIYISEMICQGYFGVGVGQCNGIFSRWCRVKPRGYVRAHTGGVDQYWNLMISAIPDNVASRRNGKRNVLLWKYIRSHQWRWESGHEDL